MFKVRRNLQIPTLASVTSIAFRFQGRAVLGHLPPPILTRKPALKFNLYAGKPRTSS